MATKVIIALDAQTGEFLAWGDGIGSLAKRIGQMFPRGGCPNTVTEPGVKLFHAEADRHGVVRTWHDVKSSVSGKYYSIGVSAESWFDEASAVAAADEANQLWAVSGSLGDAKLSVYHQTGVFPV